MMRTYRGFWSCLLVWAAGLLATHAAEPTDGTIAKSDGGVNVAPLTLVVMDPLSKPLSCDCVGGYAQREYQLLASHLEATLKRSVKVVWFESLSEALQETGGQADLIIGKCSVVQTQASEAGFSVRPVARLTDSIGDVMQHGLIVVRQDDPAKQIADLSGYRIFFGEASAEEKSSAAEAVMSAAGVTVPETRERFGACSEAAVKLMELPQEEKAAAVISSYAEPLLAGCGAIKKGDLRVLGRTLDVPFVTAFVDDSTSDADTAAIVAALRRVGEDPEMLIGLETLAGFIDWVEPKKKE